MSEGFAYLDILILAMVAGFVAFRLRSVLGRRTGHERQRPSSIGNPGPSAGNEKPTVPGAADESFDEAPVIASGDPKIKAGLTEIRLADPSFDLDAFMGGARAAFGMIVEAFAKGEKETLEPLLAGPVYRSFASAIDQRVDAGEELHTELVGVGGLELVGAEMVQTLARLTIKFTTEQVNVTRDADGEVVDGDPNEIVEVVDIWTFERDTRSRDPNWQLVETRSPA